jgi:hypothetical protein
MNLSGTELEATSGRLVIARRTECAAAMIRANA